MISEFFHLRLGCDVKVHIDLYVQQIISTNFVDPTSWTYKKKKD